MLNPLRNYAHTTSTRFLMFEASCEYYLAQYHQLQQTPVFWNSLYKIKPRIKCILNKVIIPQFLSDGLSLISILNKVIVPQSFSYALS